MVPEEIVCLHNIDIVNLRCLQDLTRAFRASDVCAVAHLAPSAERTANPNLRPNSNDQRNTDIK